MTVGAAQIVLKSSREIPEEPVWVAGSGPLPLLYIVQLLRAGGRVAGWLSTTPSGSLERAIPKLFAASKGWRDLLKGVKWMRSIARSHVLVEKNVVSLRADPGLDGCLEHIEYTTADGRTCRVKTRLLLVHEGVVPSIHVTQALGCKHTWRESQHCLVPEVDPWGRTSVPGIYAAGDGVGIGGAAAASTLGELTAVGIALDTGKLTLAEANGFASSLRRRLSTELAVRPLLDAIYRPREEVIAPADETIVCRCEELTAGQIRAVAQSGGPSPDRIKSITRAGMGPCQGRQCGYTIANILAATQRLPVSKIGFYRIRPPLKPLTLGELASLEDTEGAKASV